MKGQVGGQEEASVIETGIGPVFSFEEILVSVKSCGFMLKLLYHNFLKNQAFLFLISNNLI
jgi:hypothetical protein